MAVFTKTSSDELGAWLGTRYGIELADGPHPITEGIENTNYWFADSRARKFIFTVFEVWQQPMVDYCLDFSMALHKAGHPIPQTIACASGALSTAFADKPAAVVEFVAGESKMHPGPADCRTFGAVVAGLHKTAAGLSFDTPNQRGFDWRKTCAPALASDMGPDDGGLLEAAQRVDSQVYAANLPQGSCHCDLFRNNVLWDGDKVNGIIDFYFSGNDLFTFDLAVACIDWSTNEQGEIDRDNLQTLLAGYCSVRKLTPDEAKLLPEVFVSAALRFWLSRLLDIKQPRQAAHLIEHNPGVFRNRLASCMDHRSVIAEAVETAQAE